jgi:hypothetical protein
VTWAGARYEAVESAGLDCGDGILDAEECDEIQLDVGGVCSLRWKSRSRPAVATRRPITSTRRARQPARTKAAARSAAQQLSRVRQERLRDGELGSARRKSSCAAAGSW